MSNSDLVAQFFARGGSVSRVPAGVAYGVDPAVDRERRAMSREQRRDNDLIAQRHVRCVDHCGRSVIVNGMGELIAVE